MLEVRILNGLHRGAICPLDDAHLTIGSDEGADLVLHDRDIAGIQAELHLLGNTWWLLLNRASLSPGQGSENERIELVIGEPVSLRGVWLVVAQHADAWQFPHDVGLSTNERRARLTPSTLPRRGARRFLAPVLAILMIWTQDGVSSLEESGRPLGALPANYRHDHGRALEQPEMGDVELEHGGSRAGAEEAGRASSKKEADEKSAAILRQKLRELELDGLVSLNCAGHAWLMSGELSDEEMTRYRSMLERFQHDYPLADPLVDSVHRIPDTLPFRIVEASLGRNPSITLSDGQRLFVGDTYEGYRLDAVTKDRVVLAGKHRLSLAW